MHKIKIISQDTFMLSRDSKTLSGKLEEKVNDWINKNNIKVIKAETTTANPNTKEMVMTCTIVYED